MIELETLAEIKALIENEKITVPISGSKMLAMTHKLKGSLQVKTLQHYLETTPNVCEFTEYILSISRKYSF